MHLHPLFYYYGAPIRLVQDEGNHYSPSKGVITASLVIAAAAPATPVVRKYTD
jgi:hypothetical protein